MHGYARTNYLEAQVLTAAPQKLRLLLIEAALRHGRAAREHWRAERIWDGGESLTRCHEIVHELVAGLRREEAPELVAQVGGLYAYISRLLSTAHLRRDLTSLDEALALLDHERETWSLVCRQLGESRQDAEPSLANKRLSLNA